MGAGPPGGSIQGSSRGPRDCFLSWYRRTQKSGKEAGITTGTLPTFLREGKNAISPHFPPINQHKLFGYKL